MCVLFVHRLVAAFQAKAVRRMRTAALAAAFAGFLAGLHRRRQVAHSCNPDGESLWCSCELTRQCLPPAQLARARRLLLRSVASRATAAAFGRWAAAVEAERSALLAELAAAGMAEEAAAAAAAAAELSAEAEAELSAAAVAAERTISAASEAAEEAVAEAARLRAVVAAQAVELSVLGPRHRAEAAAEFEAKRIEHEAATDRWKQEHAAAVRAHIEALARRHARGIAAEAAAAKPEHRDGGGWLGNHGSEDPAGGPGPAAAALGTASRAEIAACGPEAAGPVPGVLAGPAGPESAESALYDGGLQVGRNSQAPPPSTPSQPPQPPLTEELFIGFSRAGQGCVPAALLSSSTHHLGRPEYLAGLRRRLAAEQAAYRTADRLTLRGRRAALTLLGPAAAAGNGGLQGPAARPAAMGAGGRSLLSSLAGPRRGTLSAERGAEYRLLLPGGVSVFSTPLARWLASGQRLHVRD